jgi:O-antigen ligase
MDSTLRLPLLPSLGVALLAAAAIVAITTLEYGYVLPVVLLGVAYVAWSYPRPVTAMVTVILLNIVLIEQSEQISPLEICVGIYSYGYALYWFLSKIFLQRRKIFSGVADLLLAAFITLAAVSVILLVARQGSVDWWFREMITIAGLGFYFPAKDAMQTERGLRSLLIAFLILSVGIAVYNLISYRTASLTASYLWELWSGRKAFGAGFFFGSAVLLMSIFLHLRGLLWKLLAVLGFVLTALALAFTFSRGFWIGTTFGIAVLLLLVEQRRRMELLLTVSLGGLLAAFIVLVFAGNLGDAILRAISTRLFTSSSFTQDISLANRIAETQWALKLFAESPVIGYGYGTLVPHYNLILGVTEYSNYLHNSYIYVLVKVGILGAVLFFGFLGTVIVQGFRRARSSTYTPLRDSVIRGSTGTLCGLLLIAMSSGVFIEKIAILVIALGSAFVMSEPDRT